MDQDSIDRMVAEAQSESNEELARISLREALLAGLQPERDRVPEGLLGGLRALYPQGGLALVMDSLRFLPVGSPSRSSIARASRYDDVRPPDLAPFVE